MKTTVIKLECKDGGERLDVFLAANISVLTRNMAQKLLDSGRVTLSDPEHVICGDSGRVILEDAVFRTPDNSGSEAPDDSRSDTGSGKFLRKNHKTAVGELYIVTMDEPEEPSTVAQVIPLDIVFEDTDIIVVNKPRGMVVHPAPGHPCDTLVNALLHHCGSSLSGIGGVKRPGIVHRIDKDTSGLLIAAKNDKAHLALAAQLSARTLSREYECVVRGVFKNDSGTVSAPIGRHPTDRKRQAVTDKNSRPAVTHYEVVSTFIGYTHLRCWLETGRTHQIRVHMAHIGHPVVGDMVYGCKKPEFGLTGQCLHARKLKFLHPSTGEAVELCADLPMYFKEILKQVPPAT